MNYNSTVNIAEEKEHRSFVDGTRGYASRDQLEHLWGEMRQAVRDRASLEIEGDATKTKNTIVVGTLLGIVGLLVGAAVSKRTVSD